MSTSGWARAPRGVQGEEREGHEEEKDGHGEPLQERSLVCEKRLGFHLDWNHASTLRRPRVRGIRHRYRGDRRERARENTARIRIDVAKGRSRRGVHVHCAPPRARIRRSASAGPAAPTADSVEDEESTARSRVGSLAMVPAGRIRAASNAARVSSVIQCGTRRTRSAPAAVAVAVKNLENFRTSTTRATETASSIHAGASSCSFTSSTAYGNDARARRVASGSGSNVRPKGAPRASSKRTSTPSDTRTAFVF